MASALQNIIIVRYRKVMLRASLQLRITNDLAKCELLSIAKETACEAHSKTVQVHGT